MHAGKRRWLLALAAGVASFFAFVIVGADAPRALTPCRPFLPVTLTGTLIEVKQGDTVVPTEQAILEGLPRQACVSPDGAPPPGNTVTLTDCDFAQFSVNTTLLP